MVRNILNSFKNAFRGIFSAITSERHIRVHIVAAAYVLWFSRFYDFSKAEYAVLFFVIALVIAAEMFNTAIEEVVDLASPYYHEKAKKAKDVAAGAVLVTAFFAVAVGIILFCNIEKFSYILKFFKSGLIKLIIFILSLVISFIFIFVLFKPKKISCQNNNKEKP